VYSFPQLTLVYLSDIIDKRE